MAQRFAGGRSRKLAGLLAEGARIGTPGAAITIGVGLNLEPAAYPPDVEARARTCDWLWVSGRWIAACC